MLNDWGMMFQDELAPGERIVWSGQPKQGFLLRPVDIFLIPFSLLWFGFALFWEFEVVVGGGGLFFALWGLPFILVGLYISFGRFLVDIARRGRTYYALTNDRAIIVSGLFNRNVRSINFRTLVEVNISERSDGRGTITFGPAHPMLGMYSVIGWQTGGGMYQPPAFEMIQDVRTVYSRIKRIQADR